MTSRRPGGGRFSSRLSGTYPLADTYHAASLAEDMERITAEVGPVVSQATGLSLPGSPKTTVIDRAEWVDRNVATFAHMTAPARRKVEERMVESGRDPAAVADMAEKLMGAESRAVLSVLARRVLGQYELVLPTGEDGDVVAYVGPNVLQIERTQQFNPAEFRYWVALHEMTHRAQFKGVPWVRDYFLGLVTELVETARVETGTLGRVFEEIQLRRSTGQPVIDDRGLLGLFGTPEQNAVVDKVQALMSLLEGHGHYVMDRVGAEKLKTQARMSKVLKGRRQDKRTAAFFKLTGLQMKLKQYEQGERFIRIVEKEADWETVGIAFRGASSLPNLAEIENPSLWLARVA